MLKNNIAFMILYILLYMFDMTFDLISKLLALSNLLSLMIIFSKRKIRKVWHRFFFTIISQDIVNYKIYLNQQKCYFFFSFFAH